MQQDVVLALLAKEPSHGVSAAGPTGAGAGSAR